MQLEQSFALALAPDDAHALLLDLERVTPCLPGARITGRTDDRQYDADMAVRIGPIRMSYRGRIEIVDVDRPRLAAILHAEAKDARGRGSARADMHMTVTPDGGGSQVHVRTDLHLTGRVAQMGRGVVQEVATDLMGQFASNLSRVAGAAPPDSSPVSSARAESIAATPTSPVGASAAGAKAAPSPTRVSAPAPARPTASAPSPESRQPAHVAPAKPPNALAMLWRILLRRLRGSTSAGATQGRVR